MPSVRRNEPIAEPGAGPSEARSIEGVDMAARINRTAAGLAILAAIVAPPWGDAAGQAVYPTQSVHLVVAQSAGSVSDSLARVVGDKLTRMWNQPVLVENRPGLAGTASVAQAPPDGHTLLFASNGHTIAKAINKNIRFDPIDDFAAVTLLVEVPLVMIVPPDSPARTLAEWIELARRSPGKLNFGSAGLASSSYLAGEAIRQNAGIDIVHVPYKGPNEAVTAVLRSDVAMYFAPVPAAQELGANGKVRVIAISSAVRNPQLPEVPTVAEAGLPGYVCDIWFGVIAPAGTPRPVIDKVQRDVGAVLAMPDIAENLRLQGMIPRPSTPDAFAALMKSDNVRYTEYLKKVGINAD